MGQTYGSPGAMGDHPYLERHPEAEDYCEQDDYDIEEELMCDEQLDFRTEVGQPSAMDLSAGIDFRGRGTNGWTRMPSPPRSAAATPSDGESDMEPYLRAAKEAKRGPLASLLTPNSKNGTGRNTPETSFQERARIRPIKCRDPRFLANMKTDEEVRALRRGHFLFVVF